MFDKDYSNLLSIFAKSRISNPLFNLSSVTFTSSTSQIYSRNDNLSQLLSANIPREQNVITIIMRKSKRMAVACMEIMIIQNTIYKTGTIRNMQ